MMPSLVLAEGSPTTCLTEADVKQHIFSFLNQLGERDDVFLLPPDITRLHSHAGMITSHIAEYYGHSPSASNTVETTNNCATLPKLQIMPALGTHAPMTKDQIRTMFGEDLASLEPSPFLVHDWRNDVETIGHVPNTMVRDATRGMVDEPWPAQLNRLVWAKRNNSRAIVLSIGQVVPHEVMGMANYNKNLFVGVGGLEAINLSHFIGAVFGIENIMGKADNPLRSIFHRASDMFLGQLELWYILTVVAPNPNTGKSELRGLYIGNDIDCYSKACELSLQVNFTMLEKPPQKVVVYLDPEEFHSTWLGNKSIYRTRLAIADGGELVVLAPGIRRFGEDPKVDELIRKYGYRGTPQALEDMKSSQELRDNLGTVAHLMHGSSEGRFSITYCPGHLTREEIEGVGFQYGSLDELLPKYDVQELQTGWHIDEATGEEYFYISNPALGLWATKDRFQES
eukprot:Nitzschia sp. Nitz4//scaffold3_size479765//97563//98927//NITZ4_000039-RA/size479765-processed-gene-0.91-mRNA-1//-1//CDS//3329550575//2693//frame0